MGEASRPPKRLRVEVLDPRPYIRDRFPGQFLEGRKASPVYAEQEVDAGVTTTPRILFGETAIGVIGKPSAIDCHQSMPTSVSLEKGGAYRDFCIRCLGQRTHSKFTCLQSLHISGTWEKLTNLFSLLCIFSGFLCTFIRSLYPHHRVEGYRTGSSGGPASRPSTGTDR
jgi:hypothetical protein